MLESPQVDSTPIRNQRSCRKHSSQGQRSYLCSFTGRQKVAEYKKDLELHLMVQEIDFNPISTKDKSPVHDFWTKMLPGIFIGCALDSGGSWTGDLIIADWHDTDNNVASEVHVKRSESNEVGINKVAGNVRHSFRRWFRKKRWSRTTSNLTPPESREIRRGGLPCVRGEGDN